MVDFSKICIVKIAWSNDYQGAPVYGRHKYTQKYRDGHERYNFLPGPDGRYYVHVPPHALPPQEHRKDWLVMVVAAPTYDNGRTFKPLVIVGWFYGATFVEVRDRPEYVENDKFDISLGGDRYTYTILSSDAVLLPVYERPALSGASTERGRKIGMKSLFFLRGPSELVKDEEWRKEYASFCEKIVTKLGDNSVDMVLDPALQAENSGGARTYATAEHRLRVEKAAENFAVKKFSKTHAIENVTDENLGYDFLLTRKGSGEKIFLEVKGTASGHESFYITRNEYAFGSNNENFRIFIVKSALSENPEARLLKWKEVIQQFDLNALTHFATIKKRQV